MISSAIHFVFFLILGLTLHATPPKETSKSEYRAKVLYGYYKGCKGIIVEETDFGIWLKVKDCKGQTGKRFFLKDFIRRLD